MPTRRPPKFTVYSSCSASVVPYRTETTRRELCIHSRRVDQGSDPSKLGRWSFTMCKSTSLYEDKRLMGSSSRLQMKFPEHMAQHSPGCRPSRELSTQPISSNMQCGLVHHLYLANRNTKATRTPTRTLKRVNNVKSLLFPDPTEFGKPHPMTRPTRGLDYLPKLLS
jgi:hypothetical protein